MRRSRVKLSIDQLELTVEGTRKPRRRASDTSAAAGARTARSNRTELLRAQILDTIALFARDPMKRGATADEVHTFTAATEMEKGDVRRLMEIRRRTSDLHTQLRQIRDTGARRANDCGNPMIVWEPV